MPYEVGTSGMWVNVPVFGSKRLSAPVDQMRPSASMRMVCLRAVSWNSVIFCVSGSQRPILFEPCSVSHTEPSSAGTAEWIAAVPTFGTGNSSTTPVAGSSRPILLARP
jgi:hypothetical protein